MYVISYSQRTIF